MVHLFKSLASRLRDKPVDPQQRQQAKDGEEDVRAVAGGFNQRWGDEADDEIEEPVRAGGETVVAR